MSTSISQQQALLAIATWSKDKESALRLFLNGEIDDCVSIVVLIEHVITVLDKAILGLIALDDLELWATILESRPHFKVNQVEGVIFALANPAQMGELSIDKLTALKQLMIPH
ncbi:hypothetical protein PALB_36070 [Pseudoalteromonas luteoviolacea B = ATCC 29581]|nr:hypothetical protein PALB_36070 [Pseudoalteromonas luteoviolacea B = ATCC 29581]